MDERMRVPLAVRALREAIEQLPEPHREALFSAVHDLADALADDAVSRRALDARNYRLEGEVTNLRAKLARDRERLVS